LSAQATASDKKGCIAAGKDAIDDGILFFSYGDIIGISN
jgi:hypothetical protein